MMVRSCVVSGAVALWMAVPAAAEDFTGDALLIENFVGVVEVRTSAGADGVRVEIDPGADVVAPPTASQRGDEVRIVGSGDDVRGCENRGGGMRLRVSRGGEFHPLSDFPSITIEAPDTVEVNVREAVAFGEIGDVGSANVAVSNCGEMTVGSVAGEARLVVAGSGGMTAGDIGGGAVLVIAGSGDVAAGSVAGDVTLTVSGSGDAVVRSVTGGTIKAAVQGSGDIVVSEGDIASLQVSVMGSGDVSFGGTAGEAQLTVMGSGDVTVASVTGDVQKTVLGSGDVHVGG